MSVEGYLVSEAALELSVSIPQVHRWIEHDIMVSSTDSSGRHWIPAHEVAYRKRLPGDPRRGRPTSQAGVWAQLMQMGDRPSLSEVERLRDRRLFERRSRRRAGEALDEIVHEIRNHPDVMLGGVDAAARYGAPATPERPPWDLYLPDTLIDRYGTLPRLRRTSAAMNVVLHFVDDTTHRSVRERFGRYVPTTVAWLDLADAGDRAAPEVWQILAE